MVKVLVIDDSRLAALTVEKTLKQRGIDCLHAQTSAEVFGFRGMPSLLRDHEFDIILLDLMMPDMHGLDVLNKLKSMSRIKEIPVIIFSASSSEQNVVETMHRGAAGFLSKPIDKDKLLKELAQVSRSAGNRELARILSDYLETGRQADQDREELRLGDANLSYLLEILDGDEELMHELVQVFVDEFDNQINDIKAAIKAKDAPVLQRTAHTYKGSVSNFGAALITDMALQLETKGRDNDFTETEEIFAKLEKDSLEMKRELIAWLAF